MQELQVLGQMGFKSGGYGPCSEPGRSQMVHATAPAVVREVVVQGEHDTFGEFVKVIVFGGLDGIITTFAVVSSIAGADLKIEVRDLSDVRMHMIMPQPLRLPECATVQPSTRH